MRHARYSSVVFLLLVFLLLGSSCAYLTDRGVDFLDQYRVVVGSGTGGGIRTSFMGLVDTGLIFGIKPHTTDFGWKYGRPLFFGATGSGMEADQSWILMTTHFENWKWGSGEYKVAKKCLGILPVLFTWTDTTYRDEPRWYVPEEGVKLEGDHYLWSGATWRDNRYAMIHAFDIESEIAVVLYLDVGFSPGETLDFLLGLLTIDPAKDDGRIVGGGE